METIEAPARNAAPDDARSARNASRSQSTKTVSLGTAGIAPGTAGCSTISKNALTWARQQRGISRATLEALGVASATGFFPDLERKSEALIFRYGNGWKARSIPDKSFVAGKGLRMAFWNLEPVLRASPECVYIVEGELDGLAWSKPV